ncbi:4-hydroxyphenylpyruvate dioxygenase, putative [Talaromyces stipitatus ATCC 10500]|uniref:4-hydroxyphenylpyruvate dioxygenase, putative n=1 Tax=Talaromyces stipitatus (strain ATCC 10500 / CBS 375.48 / QM 6759 / NRRL 1006) TaxID=441959 RepID=B8MM74_TALSN|nr:4-hydroxyphenylpyruvate dioxygenase, putative [Talaromyces stipitatus ATCC 10500]EED13586.1 4-hydroxyphenylpyruvate dioxygenase, putative [Talaromyces stipitatus ATCC 10500]
MENPLAIATVALGQHPYHSLPSKIKAAAQHGFSAVEIVYNDLASYADSRLPKVTVQDAAEEIAALCTAYNVAILSLNPFRNFEGHSSPLSKRLEAARHWIEVAQLLKAHTGDENVIIPELQHLADMTAAIAPGLKISYEAVAWGAYVSTWQDSLRVVQLVGRDNFGLCLDSFHVVARLWGDITTESGKQEQPGKNVDDILQQSLDKFVATCPLDKIFYIQLSDGEKYWPPLSPQHRFYDANYPSLLIWSRNTRPFPLETEYGSYMPVAEVARAWLVGKRWKGYVSLEAFDWRMRDEENGPEDNARRGMESWKKLLAELKNT